MKYKDVLSINNGSLSSPTNVNGTHLDVGANKEASRSYQPVSSLTEAIYHQLNCFPTSPQHCSFQTSPNLPHLTVQPPVKSGTLSFSQQTDQNSASQPHTPSGFNDLPHSCCGLIQDIYTPLYSGSQVFKGPKVSGNYDYDGYFNRSTLQKPNQLRDFSLAIPLDQNCSHSEIDFQQQPREIVEKDSNIQYCQQSKPITYDSFKQFGTSHTAQEAGFALEQPLSLVSHENNLFQESSSSGPTNMGLSPHSSWEPSHPEIMEKPLAIKDNENTEDWGIHCSSPESANTLSTSFNSFSAVNSSSFLCSDNFRGRTGSSSHVILSQNDQFPLYKSGHNGPTPFPPLQPPVDVFENQHRQKSFIVGSASFDSPTKPTRRGAISDASGMQDCSNSRHEYIHQPSHPPGYVSNSLPNTLDPVIEEDGNVNSYGSFPIDPETASNSKNDHSFDFGYNTNKALQTNSPFYSGADIQFDQDLFSTETNSVTTGSDTDSVEVGVGTLTNNIVPENMGSLANRSFQWGNAVTSLTPRLIGMSLLNKNKELGTEDNNCETTFTDTDVVMTSDGPGMFGPLCDSELEQISAVLAKYNTLQNEFGGQTQTVKEDVGTESTSQITAHSDAQMKSPDTNKDVVERDSTMEFASILLENYLDAELNLNKAFDIKSCHITDAKLDPKTNAVTNEKGKKFKISKRSKDEEIAAATRYLRRPFMSPPPPSPVSFDSNKSDFLIQKSFSSQILSSDYSGFKSFKQSSKSTDLNFEKLGTSSESIGTQYVADGNSIIGPMAVLESQDSAIDLPLSKKQAKNRGLESVTGDIRRRRGLSESSVASKVVQAASKAMMIVKQEFRNSNSDDQLQQSPSTASFAS